MRPNGIHPAEIGSASFLFFNIYELCNVSRFTRVMAFGSGSAGTSDANQREHTLGNALFVIEW